MKITLNDQITHTTPDEPAKFIIVHLDKIDQKLEELEKFCYKNMFAIILITVANIIVTFI